MVNDRCRLALIDHERLGRPARYDRYDDPVWLARWSANDSHPLPAPYTAAPGFALTVEPLDWYAEGPAGVLNPIRPS